MGGASWPSDTWWDPNGYFGAMCALAYQPFGAPDYAGSLVDLTGNGNNATAPVAAPTWAAISGWTLNGVNQYLRTNYVPGGAFYSWLFVYWSAWTWLGTDAVLAGTWTPYWFIQRYTGGANQRFGYRNGLTGSSGPYVGTGVAGSRCYVNGVFFASPSGATQTVAVDAWIGVSNNAGAPGQYANCTIKALAIYNTGGALVPPDAQWAAIDAATRLTF